MDAKLLWVKDAGYLKERIQKPRSEPAGQVLIEEANVFFCDGLDHLKAGVSH